MKRLRVFKIWIFSLLVFGSLITSCSSPCDSAKECYVQGVTNYWSDNLEQAIRDYTKAIGLDPSYMEAYNDRGVAYYDLGNLEQAKQDYNKAIELNPNYAPAYNNRALVYGDLNDLEQAIRDYNKAIELNPDYTVAYYNRGSTYHDLDDPEQAIRDYNKAIELEPDFLAAHVNRGNAWCDTGNLEQAIQDYTKAIELKPDLALAYFNRATAYRSAGDEERATEDYTKAVELNPGFALTNSNDCGSVGTAPSTPIWSQVSQFVQAIIIFLKSLFGGEEPPINPPSDDGELPPIETVIITPIADEPPTIPPGTDNARFDKDITLPDTLPDGRMFPFPVFPGEKLVKIWQLENIGNTTWGNGYQLAFVDGDHMEAPDAVNLPPVAPGEKVELCVRMKAPSGNGIYRGNWKLRNPQGVEFGDKIWVNLQVCTERFPESHDGFDCQEKYLLDLLNNYRGEQCELEYDNDLQEAAENWAKNAPCNTEECHSISDEVMADMSGSDDKEGAYNALYGGCPAWCGEKEVLEGKCFCWSKSPNHNKVVTTCAYTRVGIGHAQTGDRRVQCPTDEEGWCYDWAWVAQFGNPEPPNLVLDGDVEVDPNPVGSLENVNFTFSIKNVGKTEQIIKDIFVLAITPEGLEWKAKASPKNITPSGTEVFVASAPTSNEAGIWQVKEISFQDNNSSWFSLNNPNCRLLNPSFTVVVQ
jgi:Flp pilus assembly protein TadD